MKRFKIFLSFFVLVTMALMILGAPVMAASRNWDGNYDATVQGNCDPWIIMDSWTVMNNSVVTPYSTADIDQWDGAQLEVFAGSTRVELVNFVFKDNGTGKGFTASWIVNARSDGSGNQCQGTLNGKCTSGCVSFDIGALFTPTGPGMFIVFVIIIIIVILISVVITKARLRRVTLPPEAEPIIANQPQVQNLPPAVNPAVNPPASIPVPLAQPPKTKTTKPRKFRPVYGKKFAKKGKLIRRTRIQT